VNKSHDAAENYCRRPTLTTGVHFGLDDGDGFFNPASRAFAALRDEGDVWQPLDQWLQTANISQAELAEAAAEFQMDEERART
jgi:hypothetical protein